MTPAEIKGARAIAKLTQTAAGELVGATLRTWQDWEYGHRPMPARAWDMFLLYTGQHPTHRLVEKSAAP